MERRDEASDWTRLGSISANRSGWFSYEDRTVAESARHAYRLAYAERKSERLPVGTWGAVPPAFRPSLEAFRPNPAGACSSHFPRGKVAR